MRTKTLDGSYVHNCNITFRQTPFSTDEPLPEAIFQISPGEEKMITRLDGYAVMPRESYELRQLALQGLADALKQMLAVFPPEFDEKWAESSGEKIQVQAWNQARAALEAAKPFSGGK